MGDQINITTEDGDFGAYIARPSTTPAPAIVVLHEVFGVNADMRQTCDTLAAKGFFAVCPDLFWRSEPGVDLDVRSEDDWNHGLSLWGRLDRDKAVGDIVEALKAAESVEGASGRCGLLGYCMGALLTFLTAARAPVDAAVWFHGAETEKYLVEASGINAPFLMHFATADEFIPQGAQRAIKDDLAGKPNVLVFDYADCRHAFTRHNGAHYDANAAKLANARTWAFLGAHLN